MEQQEIFAWLRKIISAELEIPEEEIESSTSLVDDLNLDSLQLVTIIIALEGALGIKISGEDLGEISTVGEIVQQIATLL